MDYLTRMRKLSTKMRPIKFRAWDKKEKHFVYFELFQGVNNRTPDIYSHADLEPWEQYLGMNDVNGEEIYERDIVKRGIVVKEVVYDSEWAGFCGFNIKGTGWVYNKPKVVGNKHEGVTNI